MRAAIFASLFAFVVASSYAQEPETPASTEDLEERIFQGEFTAGAEVRYQNQLADRYRAQWGQWSTWSLVLAGVGLIGAFITANNPFKKMTTWVHWAVSTVFVLIGLAGFFASMKSAETAAADRFIDHAVLSKQWEALGSEWSRLALKQTTMTPDQLAASVDALLVQESSLQGAEPHYRDGDLWKAAWREEAATRQVEIPPPDNTGVHS